MKVYNDETSKRYLVWGYRKWLHDNGEGYKEWVIVGECNIWEEAL